MIRMLLIFSATSLAFISFITTSNYASLNNTFESFNYTLSKQWVVTDIEGESVNPIFDSKIVESTSIEHFKANLKGKVDSFKLGFYYFNEETLEETSNRYATGVRVSLKAKLMFNTEFYKASIFEVSKSTL